MTERHQPVWSGGGLTPGRPDRKTKIEDPFSPLHSRVRTSLSLSKIPSIPWELGLERRDQDTSGGYMNKAKAENKEAAREPLSTHPGVNLSPLSYLDLDRAGG